MLQTTASIYVKKMSALHPFLALFKSDLHFLKIIFRRALLMVISIPFIKLLKEITGSR